MKPAICVLFVFLLAVINTFAPMYGQDKQVSWRERLALSALYDETDGRNWKERAGWKTAPGTEHSWYGITCNPPDNNKVLEIVLGNNNLKGTLPAELGDLKNLETLVLNQNKLTGLHRGLGNLSNLTTLDLGNNRLRGPIPPWIAKLKNLKKLDLSNNGFTGAIPSWLGDLRNLEELRLDGNHLQGPVPKALGNLSKLTVLRIGHNRLTGEIPSAAGKLTRLMDNKSNFKWNGLYTGNTSLRAFLEKKQVDGDWESTQTIAPKEVTAVSSSKNDVTITWKTIAYTKDGGGYRVFYSPTRGGPYTPVPTTGDKTATGIKVTGLRPGTRYYFVVRAWTAGHGSNRNSVESGNSKEISAVTRGIVISGSVTTPDNEAVRGVEMKAVDNAGSTITRFTDSNGKYDLNVMPGWSGTVTPSKKGYEFEPSGKEYLSLGDDPAPWNFKANKTTVISGRVTDSEGSGAAGVTLRFSAADGKENYETTTDQNGEYRQAVVYDWNGTVTPVKAFNNDIDYEFKPPSRTFRVISFMTGDYEAVLPPVISGEVRTRGGKGIPGVTLIFRNPGKGIDYKVVTDRNGEYSRIVDDSWSGTVTPRKKDYFFQPRRKVCEKVKGKVKMNYNGLNLKFFVTVTGSYMRPSADGFQEIYGSGLLSPEITAGYKFPGDFYVWGGYGFFYKNGISPDLGETSTWRGTFLSGGVGYNDNKNRAKKFEWRVEVGVSYFTFSEEAFGLEFSGSAVGFRVGGAGIFKVTDFLFTEVSVGYLRGTDSINDVTIDLGGFKTGIGIGLRF